MTDIALPILTQPERLSSFDGRTALRRLADSDRLASGCVVIIGIDAIRARLQAQWAAKREMVWEAVGRTLDRRLGPSGIWAQVGEVDFVVCADDDPAASRAKALKVLRELLEFFLGAQRFEDMRIAAVISISDDFEFACAALDPRAIEREEVGSAPANTTAPDGWTALSFASEESAIALEFERERIVNLRNGAVIANRLWARMRDTRTDLHLSDRWPELLSSANLSAVNAMIISQAKTLYAESDRGVFLSASIHTLAQPRNRADVIRHLEQVKRDPTRPIMIELIDIDRGTPQSRIAEIVSVLAPHCRKVLARVPIDRPAVDLLRGCRLSGLSIDCENLQHDPRHLLLKLSRFTEMAKPVSPLTFALRLHGEGSRELALIAGITHAGCSASVH